MSQKKKYSRNFIILQEDEKGYGLASDKAPTGYAKIEVKNNKCKISFYVQNLKKEMKPYYILLICNKKDEKKLVKLGELNIDNTGRAEVSKEFTPENIAASGVSVDKVCGAAVIRSVDTNIIGVLNGFSITDIPNDWKKYTLVDNVKKRENDEKTKSENQNSTVEHKDRSFDEYEEKIEKVKVEKETKQNNSSDDRNEPNKDSNILEPTELKEKLKDLNDDDKDSIRNSKKNKDSKHDSNKNKDNKSKVVDNEDNKDSKDNKDNKDNK
ncbi:MAG: hypothetical protein K0R06_3102, partial [Clostridium sp.]|nr:hypothetical protein [Clostridium sp.]